MQAHHKELHAVDAVYVQSQLLLELLTHGLAMGGNRRCSRRGHVHVLICIVLIVRDLDVQVLRVLLPLDLTVGASCLMGEAKVKVIQTSSRSHQRESPNKAKRERI